MNIWFERGFRRKPYGYEVTKMFPAHSFLAHQGSMGAHEHMETKSEMQLLGRFYQKYPEVKYFPTHNHLY